MFEVLNKSDSSIPMFKSRKSIKTHQGRRSSESKATIIYRYLSTEHRTEREKPKVLIKH